MSTPVSFVWPSVDTTTTAVAGSQVTVANQPLVMNTLGVGCDLIIPDMERCLRFTTSAGCIFDISARDMFGNEILSTTTSLNGTHDYPTAYHRITYIIPRTSGITVSVGYGGQGHMYYVADTLRKTWGCSVQAQILDSDVIPTGIYTLFTNLIPMQTVNTQTPTNIPLIPGSPTTLKGTPRVVYPGPTPPLPVNVYFKHGDSPPADPIFTLGTPLADVAQQLVVPYPVATVGVSVGYDTSVDAKFSMLFTILQMGIR